MESDGIKRDVRMRYSDTMEIITRNGTQVHSSPVLEKLFPDLSNRLSIILFLSWDLLSDCKDETSRVKETAIFSTFRSLTCVERFDSALPRWVVRGFPPTGLLRLFPGCTDGRVDIE